MHKLKLNNHMFSVLLFSKSRLLGGLKKFYVPGLNHQGGAICFGSNTYARYSAHVKFAYSLVQALSEDITSDQLPDLDRVTHHDPTRANGVSQVHTSY